MNESKRLYKRKIVFLQLVRQGAIPRPDPEEMAEWTSGRVSIGGVTLDDENVHVTMSKEEYYSTSITAISIHLRMYVTREWADAILTLHGFNNRT